jgi:hypothetical protein
VFRHLVIARIIEPSSKLDSARVLAEAGVVPASYPTVWRRLRVYARDSWRTKLPPRVLLTRGSAGDAGALRPVPAVLRDRHGDEFGEP